MRKLAFGLVAAAAAIFGVGIVANAAVGYDPAVVVDPASPDPGGAYTVTYLNCVVGDTITFTQSESTPESTTGECEAVEGSEVVGSMLGLLMPQQQALGSAVGYFTAAPTEAGEYHGTAGGVRSEELPFSFTIVVDTPTEPTEPTTPTELPETGANGISTTTGVALGLLVVGLGLFVVTQVRRKQNPTAV